MTYVVDHAMAMAAIEADGFAMLRRDAVDMLGAMPAGCVDCFALDPAYESLEKHRAWGTTTRLTHSLMSSNDWFDIFRNERFPELLVQMYRVLRRHAHAYIMCDDKTSDIVKPMAKEAGFTVWDRLVWDKKTIGMGYHWRKQTEFVLFLEKGRRRLNHLGWSNVLEFKRVAGKDTYPTEKPWELFERLILNSTQPGELVMDPFAGSGACGVAALANGRLWLGTDTSEVAVALARGRLLKMLEEAVLLEGV